MDLPQKKEITKKMKTELSELIHLYLGCECLDASNVIYTLKPSHLPSNWQTCDHPHKLILRPLSSMTDEEARIIWNLYDGSPAITNPKCALTDHTFHANFTPKEWFSITQHLFKLGFDLFDLIPSGQAIDKTTLNK